MKLNWSTRTKVESALYCSEYYEYIALYRIVNCNTTHYNRVYTYSNRYMKEWNSQLESKSWVHSVVSYKFWVDEYLFQFNKLRLSDNSELWALIYL